MVPTAVGAVAALAAGFVIVVAPLSPGAADEHREPSEEDVTAAVQVTSNPSLTRAHSSPQIAINPLNGELVVAETDLQGTTGDPRSCNVHISIDEGRSWAPGGNPMMEPYTECSRVAINGPYQTLAFAPDGTLYLAFAATDPRWANPHPNSVIPRHIFLARSDDGGRTFETTHLHAADPDEPPEDSADFPRTSGNQRPMVALDPNDSQRVYVGWLQGGERDDEKDRGLVVASTDGGETFSDPVDVTDDRGGSQPRLAVDGEGTVHAVYGAMTFGLPEDDGPHNRPLVYRRSTDAGQTWSDVEEIDPGEGNNRKWILTADPTSQSLYVAWDGNREVGAVGEDDYRDVYVRISHDAGDSWSEPVTVHEDPQSPEGVKRYHPGIDVAPNGRLDVVWYDFRNSPVPEGVAEGHDGYFHAGGMQDVYYSALTPGDNEFGADVRVTDRIIDRNIGVWSNNVHSYTNLGIASTDDRVYVVWQDSRQGDPDTNSEDVYFASVRLDDWQQQPVSAVESGDENTRVGLWALLAAVFLLGMGMATLLAVPIRRRVDKKA